MHCDEIQVKVGNENSSSLFYFECHKMTPKREAQEKRRSTL